MTTLSEFVESRLDRWQHLLQELIRTPSCFEAEHALVAQIEQYLASLDVPVTRVHQNASALRNLPAAQHPISEVDGRDNLIVRVPGLGGGKSLILNTHLDIVPEGSPAAWTHPPFRGDIDPINRIIYGRGAMDDKAGVTIALAVLETLVKLPLALAGDVEFQFVLEDETTGNGSLLCLNSGSTADAALIIDGTRSEKAIDRHAGNLQFDILVEGKTASVSVSHMGVNAAEMMARLLLHLREAVFALNAQRIEPWLRFPSPYQFVVQHMHSDSSQLTLPETAFATCYVTFPPPFTLKTMQGFLMDQVAGFATQWSLPAIPSVKWSGLATEPVQSDITALAPVLQQCAADVGFPPIDISPSTGTSDLRHFVAANIPCMLYGPGRGFNPHRPDEHYYLDDLPRMVAFYLAFVSRWCGIV